MGFIDPRRESMRTEVHRNQKSMRMEMESTSGSAMGAEEESMAQEGVNVDQDVAGEETDNTDGGQSRDQKVNKQDDNCTGKGEDENPHEEERDTAHPQHSSKRIKKLKMDREAQPPREMTRSEMKTRTPQRL